MKLCILIESCGAGWKKATSIVNDTIRACVCHLEFFPMDSQEVQNTKTHHKMGHKELYIIIVKGIL